MNLLKDKVALITGASKGIGRGIALKFAQEGANVAFTYLSSVEQGIALEKELEAFGIKAKGYRSDASERYPLALIPKASNSFSKAIPCSTDDRYVKATFAPS